MRLAILCLACLMVTSLYAANLAAQPQASDTVPQALVPTPPDDFARARELAGIGAVPLATVLTDLITKAAQDNFTTSIEAGRLTGAQSTMFPDFSAQPTRTGQSPTIFSQSPASSTNQRDEFLAGVVPFGSPAFNNALARGYTPRPVEFDARYEANIARLLSYSEPASSISAGNARIWNGIPVPAKDDAFLDAVAITGNGGICSGILIGPDLVVTAAHCFCGGVMEEVLVGQTILSPAERIPVAKDKSEPFIPCELLRRNIALGDVALLRLQRAAAAPPRLIGGLPMVRAAAAIRAVGFGRTSNDNIGVKYQINIVIASFQCDGSAFSGLPDKHIYRCEAEHELVAAGLNRDTCGGDSGGPAYVFGPDGRIYLAGITSRAIDPTGRCGPGGIYVLLSAPPIRGWLEARGAKIH